MSSKTFASATDFLHGSDGAANKDRGILAGLRNFSRTVADARSAAFLYEDMVAHGVPAGDAARKVYERVYAQK